ncbi:hypothetical protein [Pedobacter insulae]|uniref:Outer membrane protein beta-barrel domain-containing protein n=1 Tax=Pedobacter insulae TaxID=414048 RepID=A0A1I2Y2J1_9SPHI|nr:hypothetical protein [Pedobacter insulae]SFH19569.1 hypothetical protein SAMN04489864_106172 [Pedobacter insulae]
MKKKIEEEEAFFNQVEEVLQGHEDAYEVGAWEEFVVTRKKRIRKWPVYAWTAAAAVLLLLSFGLFEVIKKDPLQTKDSLVKNEVQTPKRNSESEFKANNDNLIVEEEVTIAHKQDGNPKRAAEKSIVPIISKVDPPIIAVAQNKPAENSSLVPDYTPKDVAVTGSLTDKLAENSTVRAGTYDSLMNRNRVANVDEKSTKKLSYALVVSPAIGNQKMNFGGGMELSYKLGRHLSISSGLMYTAITAKSDGSSLVASSNSIAQDANLALTGIELPLGIQYHTKGGFYAAAGVSALGLINDKLEYTYSAEGLASMPQYAAGSRNEVLVAVNENQTEKSIEPLNNYMGFFNFSAGKKQNFGNVNLNIGPFVKVPFSSVTSEKIRLLQGGVKISIEF